MITSDTDKSYCPLCNAEMKVRNTKIRKIVTCVHGHFKAKETVSICVNRCRYPNGLLVTSRSESIKQTVASGANFGYDLEVRVGLERYIHHKQRLEIQSKLKEEGIDISTGSISSLAQRFLQHLEILHKMRSEELSKAMDKDGGFPLHIDATGEEGRGTLLVAYSGWRHWVLDAWKISSERGDIIEERINEVINVFGSPCAFMRDLGRGMRLATDNVVANLKTPIPILACHFHFLKDIGKDLLEPGNTKLRNLFREFKITKNLRSLSRELGKIIGKEHLQAKQKVMNGLNKLDITKLILTEKEGIATIRLLCQWILDYKNDSTKLQFPFDQPYLNFFNRCSKMFFATQYFLDNTIKDKEVQKKLEKLANIIKPVISEVPFLSVVNNLEERIKLFNTLRDLLRMPSDNKNAKWYEGNNLQQVMEELEIMEEAVNDYMQDLNNTRFKSIKSNHDLCKAYDIIIKHLEKHNKHLWGHAIHIHGQTGERFRLVDRTNNILEDFFNDLKRKERRRSGRKLLAHDFENLPAAAALALNLTKQDYVEIVCGSLDNLPKIFSEIDDLELYYTLMKEESPYISKQKKETVTTSFPSKDRKFARNEDLHNLIETAAQSLC